MFLSKVTRSTEKSYKDVCESDKIIDVIAWNKKEITHQKNNEKYIETIISDFTYE